MHYQTEKVRFDSHGDEIVGLLFVPETTKAGAKLPAITIIGPIGFVKEQAPIQYGTRLATEGFVTLIYDPRYHGESGGEPRRLEGGRPKIEDVQTSVDFLMTQPGVDPNQIYGLAICQGVNWMIEAVNEDARLKKLILVAGHYLLPEVAEAYVGGKEALQARLAQAEEAKAHYEQTGEVVYMPIVSETEPHKAHLGAKPVHDWYIDWEDKGHGWHFRGGWENRIATMSELNILGHAVDKAMQQLTTPTLMIHANRAATGPQVPKALFDLIPTPEKKLVWLDDEVQIQFYEDPLTIDQCVHHISQWLRKEAVQPVSNLTITLQGRTFSYEVSGYHIQLTFEEETQLRWEYLAVPEGEELRSDTETIDRTDVRSDVVLMSWTEATGVHVIDVLDLTAMKLHVTFVTAEGQRFVTQADVTEVQ